MEAGPYVNLLGSETMILYRWQGPLVHFQNFVLVIVVCTVMRLEEGSGILHVLISSQVFSCPFMSFHASSYYTFYLDFSCVWYKQWGLQVRNFHLMQLLSWLSAWKNATGQLVTSCMCLWFLSEDEKMKQACWSWTPFLTKIILSLNGPVHGPPHIGLKATFAWTMSRNRKSLFEQST